VALGNPGERYRDSRHNVGWWLADRLRREWDAPPFLIDQTAAWTRIDRQAVEIELIKPLTFVNRSGEVAAELDSRETFDAGADLLVLLDDVSLPPGRIRIRGQGSAGGHNGLASVERALGRDTYARLRIGVGGPHDDRIDLANWVLASMGQHDEERVLAAFDHAFGAVECWLAEGVGAAMNRYNA